jgi:hypothetical protein
LQRLGLSETTWEDAKEKYLSLSTQSLQLDSFWKAVCSAFLKPCNLCQPLQRLAG